MRNTQNNYHQQLLQLFFQSIKAASERFSAFENGIDHRICELQRKTWIKTFETTKVEVQSTHRKSQRRFEHMLTDGLNQSLPGRMQQAHDNATFGIGDLLQLKNQIFQTFLAQSHRERTHSTWTNLNFHISR